MNKILTLTLIISLSFSLLSSAIPLSLSERMLAAQNPLTQMDRPHQLFADAPPSLAAAPIPPALPTHITPPYMPSSMMAFMPGMGMGMGMGGMGMGMGGMGGMGMGMGGPPLHLPPPPPPTSHGSECGALWLSLVPFGSFAPPSPPLPVPPNQMQQMQMMPPPPPPHVRLCNYSGIQWDARKYQYYLCCNPDTTIGRKNISVFVLELL